VFLTNFSSLTRGASAAEMTDGINRKGVIDRGYRGHFAAAQGGRVASFPVGRRGRASRTICARRGGLGQRAPTPLAARGQAQNPRTPAMPRAGGILRGIAMTIRVRLIKNKKRSHKRWAKYQTKKKDFSPQMAGFFSDDVVEGAQQQGHQVLMTEIAKGSHEGAVVKVSTVQALACAMDPHVVGPIVAVDISAEHLQYFEDLVRYAHSAKDRDEWLGRVENHYSLAARKKVDDYTRSFALLSFETLKHRKWTDIVLIQADLCDPMVSETIQFILKYYFKSSGVGLIYASNIEQYIIIGRKDDSEKKEDYKNYKENLTDLMGEKTYLIRGYSGTMSTHRGKEDAEIKWDIEKFNDVM
jgi:hypothetical protein